jgi:hypothetical protein
MLTLNRCTRWSDVSIYHLTPELGIAPFIWTFLYDPSERVASFLGLVCRVSSWVCIF